MNKVKAGELVYGGLVRRPEMPIYKCLTCQNKFAVGQRTRMLLSSARLASSFVLAMFVGYYAASATIVSDSVAQSVISQLISASIPPPAAVADLVMWVLGMLAVMGFLVIGWIKKSKTIVSGGLGYLTVLYTLHGFSMRGGPSCSKAASCCSSFCCTQYCQSD